MHRNALEFIKKWWKSEFRRPLIIRGARQVGKSYLVRQFAREGGLDLLEVNFEKEPDAADLFQKQSIQKTCEFLTLRYKIPIDPAKTLLFLDEIQAAPQVIPVLRYFYEERPDLRVISAGSLLEFVLKDHQFSMPVGRVEYFYLGPMTFEEYLFAAGEKNLCRFIADLQATDAVPLPLHKQLMDHVRTYFVVGGMPEAIGIFRQASWEECERIKKNILAAYQDDFSKYRGRIPDLRLRKVFQKMPRLIGEKLKYVNVDPEERSKDLAQALDLLCMARVGHKVLRCLANGIPLGAEVQEKFFKILFLDVGMVCSSCGLNRLDLEAGDLNLVNQGKLSEQFVGQHLLYDQPSGQAPELYYWARERCNAAAEVDYIVASGSKIIPVEVKSGKTGRLKSLQVFLQEKKRTFGLRFNSQPPALLKQDGRLLLSLPFYLIGQWRRMVETI